MKSLYQIATIKLSPVFVVLVILIVAVFAYAMVNIARLPTMEELADKQITERILAEETQAMGGAVENVRQRDHDIRSLSKAILQKNNSEVTKLIHALKNNPKILNHAFSSATNANNEYAFRALLESGVSCDYPSPGGIQAFRGAIRSKNTAFFDMLLEKKCNYSANSTDDILGKIIVQSRHPERVFKLPDEMVDHLYRDQAFLKAIKNKMTQQVLSMLELNANPNTISRNNNKSALYFSLQNNMPKVALRLIQQGAMIKTDYLIHQYEVFSWAIRRRYLDISREILKREPNYIQENNLGESALSSALRILDDINLRREAVTLIIQNGAEPSKSKNGGVRWLIEAINIQDPIIVKQLLNKGIDPNKPQNMRTALGIAKSIKNKPMGLDKTGINSNKSQIINILKQSGATDDLLAIIRKKNGRLSANCKLGRKVNIETKTNIDNLISDRKKNHLDICISGMMICTNQGVGADDCMRSIQKCNSSDTDTPSLCCTKELTSRYFEARCSGFHVSESIRWITMESKKNHELTLMKLPSIVAISE